MTLGEDEATASCRKGTRGEFEDGCECILRVWMCGLSVGAVGELYFCYTISQHAYIQFLHQPRTSIDW